MYNVAKRLSCEWLHLMTIGIFYVISKVFIRCLELIVGKRLSIDFLIMNSKQAFIFLMVIILYYFLGDWLINFLDELKTKGDKDII